MISHSLESYKSSFLCTKCNENIIFSNYNWLNTYKIPDIIGIAINLEEKEYLKIELENEVKTIIIVNAIIKQQL